MNEEFDLIPTPEDPETPNEVISQDDPQKPSVFASVFDIIETLALYFAVAIVILITLFTHSPVDGTSMVPTLEPNDLLIVRRLGYSPQNGDIIVCQSPTYGLNKPLVKRVIATEGQRVVIDYKNWTVTVDGVTLDEDYINRIPGADMLSSYLGEEFTVPENHIFVMGDNRNGSVDSRSEHVGFIDERYVVGKVALRLMPINKFELF